MPEARAHRYPAWRNSSGTARQYILQTRLPVDADRDPFSELDSIEAGAPESEIGGARWTKALLPPGVSTMSLLDPLPFAIDAFGELVLIGNVPPYRFHPFTVGFDFGIAGVNCASMILLSRGKTPANCRRLVLRHLST